MEYTVSKLARLSGVSARTLRYYDEIDLLKPKRVNTNGYRIYGAAEVDLLQQILFYRELDLSLDEIKELLDADNFNVKKALRSHLVNLNEEKNRLDALIETVEKSIREQEGEIIMVDQEKFEAFKKDQIRRNEERYGVEVREKYGDKVVEQSNKQFGGLSTKEYKQMEVLTDALNEKLADATGNGDPASIEGQAVAKLHQEWIMAAWPEGLYDEDKHYNLSLMYVEDERFKAYYEKVASGAAEYLHEALKVYLNRE